MIYIALYFLTIVALGIFSYGFIDPNLTLTSAPLFLRLQEPLSAVVYHNRPVAATALFIMMVVLFACYVKFLRHTKESFMSCRMLFAALLVVSVILVFSYPALTYDLFNYITTAKVTYTYRENPYVVMPVEIPNEPYLAFTRAANKVALYGPVWILITALPHYLGGSYIWRTIIAFKLMNALVYFGFSYLIYRVTKSLRNVIFFALNPLTVIEVLISGHNDIFMMLFVISGLLLWWKNKIQYRILGVLSFGASWLVKGATIALMPVFCLPRKSIEEGLTMAYWLMAFVFFVFAPIREELYPWYAVWLIMLCALLPLARHRFIVAFTVVLSFALELRHLPYVWMGYYEGFGPMLRLGLTVIPVALFLIVWFMRSRLKHI